MHRNKETAETAGKARAVAVVQKCQQIFKELPLRILDLLVGCVGQRHQHHNFFLIFLIGAF